MSVGACSRAATAVRRSPTVSGIAAHAARDDRHLEGHRLEQRDAEALVLARGHERARDRVERHEVGRRRPCPTTCTRGRFSSRTCSTIARVIRRSRWWPTSISRPSTSRYVVAMCIASTRKSGRLCGMSCPTDSRIGASERPQVVASSPARGAVRASRRGSTTGGTTRTFSVAHRLELARVVRGVGDREHDPVRQLDELAAAQIEQLGERGVVRARSTGRA